MFWFCCCSSRIITPVVPISERAFASKGGENQSRELEQRVDAIGVNRVGKLDLSVIQSKESTIGGFVYESSSGQETAVILGPNGHRRAYVRI